MKTVFQVSIIIVDSYGGKEYIKKVFESSNTAERYKNLCEVNKELINCSLKLNDVNVSQLFISNVEKIEFVEETKGDGFIKSFMNRISNIINPANDFYNLLTRSNDEPKIVNTDD